MPFPGNGSALCTDVRPMPREDSLYVERNEGRVQVLEVTNLAERAAWLQAWENCPDREVFAHPAYVRLFARECDQVFCAWMDHPGGGILFPFILRPLAAEPWADGQEMGCDVTSPYGYGGPFSWNIRADAATHFWKMLDDWLIAHGVVSQLIRLSLFDDQQLPIPGEVEPVLPNVVRSLDLDPAAVWQDYEYKVRKNVKRARADRLTVEFDSTGERLDEFLNIYYATMDRRDAANSYYFPRSFFESVCDQLAGQFVFCHVRRGSTAVSSELVLVSRRHLYSFLGGTLPEAFPSRPNDLLKHEVIGWGQQAGKRAFVLGGGYHGDDGIYRYKRSFAPQGTEWFRIGKRILLPDAYERSVKQRQVWHACQASPWSPRPGYFPAYRG